ncbi:MAG: hypothetical protein WCS37_19105 [Chloroflexota bacterium]
MSITEESFREIREELVQQGSMIAATEKRYMNFLQELTLKTADRIRNDFN